MPSIFLAIITAILTYLLTTYKIKIDYKYMREQKWLDKELEVITTIWEYLQQAKNSTYIALADLKQYPNHSDYEKDDFIKLLKDLGAKETQINQINSSENIQKSLQDFMDKSEVNNAMAEFNTFVNELNKSKIFLRPELKTPIVELSKLLKNIIIERDVYLDFNNDEFHKNKRNKQKEIEELFNKLEVNLDEIIFLKNESLIDKLTFLYNNFKRKVTSYNKEDNLS
ncbi:MULTISPECIES: hypothetical protein [Francisella]|uniref:hypothetical protein n=1 Tax=Francisella TaxID=262 RepID=UPI0011B436A1|nr:MULTISPECIES: hypothetical protein [Francisella]